MRDVSLFKNVADGFETQTLVEWNGGELGMETEDLRSLSAGFGYKGMHKARTKALSAFEG